MRCHLIGLNHAHQLEGYEHGAFEVFGQYLTKFCVNANIDLLAEELNQEAVTLWRAKESVARTVATRLSINHLFCDPTLVDRRCLGILPPKEIASNLGYGRCRTSEQEAILTAEEKKTWSIREQFWLEQLGTVCFQECAFILGSSHVETFSALLTTKGIQVHVAHRLWVPS